MHERSPQRPLSTRSCHQVGAAAAVRLILLHCVFAASLTGCGESDRRGRARADASVDGSSPADMCSVGASACDGLTHYQCGVNGARLDEVVCDRACDAERGCLSCAQGQRQCDGSRSLVCNRTGDYVEARDCAATGASCGGGFCDDACGRAESSRSNIGCEYWPTPLANSGDFRGRYDFRVVIANPGDVVANVTIFQGTRRIAGTTIPPNGLDDVTLPWVFGQSDFPELDTSYGSTVVAEGAYRLVSDVPVTVAQFNPFEYDNGLTVEDPSSQNYGGPDFSYSNDASLLLPQHSFTSDYLVPSFQPTSLRVSLSQSGALVSQQDSSLPGLVTVVGVTNVPTRVTITPTAPVAADSGGRFPATAAGQPIEVQLVAGETITLFSQTPPPCTPDRPGYVTETQRAEDIAQVVAYCDEFTFDLTGTRVQSDNAVAVFGGHVCAFVPDDSFACDHLENQIPPLQTWGRNYVSAPLRDLGDDAVNIVRVMGATDGTMVTVSPPQGGVSEFVLGSGQWQEFRVTGGFQVTGSHGILVTQYLVGQAEGAWRGNELAPRGDPAMVILPPREQFRSDYTFVAPTSYNAGTLGQSYLLIIRSEAQQITLDGREVSVTWNPLGDREWGILPIDGGTHSMDSVDEFGVIVYGLGQQTSYAYPAGLNLNEIFLI